MESVDQRCFPHQDYGPRPEGTAVLLKPPPPDAPTGEEQLADAEQLVDAEQLAEWQGCYRRAGVRVVVLVHGTFVGSDALGLARTVSRFAPDAAGFFRQWNKRFWDAVASDHGNYTAGYAAALERWLNAGSSGVPIRVERFDWSSENHHIGRADGAIRLLARLMELRGQLGEGRVLCWGHSHGGNLFALLTQLLAAPRVLRTKFFETASIYYRRPWLGRIDLPVWASVRRQLLARDTNPLNPLELDLVTFGTPVRYGWATSGCRSLLHFIHHRPRAGLPVDRGQFPPTMEDLLTAAGGDYVQQLAIAGTNTGPDWLAWRAHLADRRLKRLVQRGIRSRDLWKHLAGGVRTPDRGQVLLIDYDLTGQAPWQHLAGHAVYTQTRWLKFHVSEVARRLYSPDPTC